MPDTLDSILFDLGGVLFRYDPARRLNHLAELTGLAPDLIHETIWRSDFDPLCEEGHYKAHESHLEFCRRLKVKLDYQSYRHAMALAFEPDLEVFAIARALSHHHDIAVLTNNWEVVEAALRASYPELQELFSDRLYFTWRLGGRKPDRKVFQKCLKNWGKGPDQVLFIDDSKGNVEGSLAAGLSAYLYENASALSDFLRSHHLLPPQHNQTPS